MSSGERHGVGYWSLLAGLAATLLGAAIFVSRSVAAEQVAPIDRRVTTLEAQRTEDARARDEIKQDVKELRQDMKELLRRVK